MTPLALFDVHPVGVEITLVLLGVGIVAAVALAAPRLWKARAAGAAADPWTRFLIAAPKRLGVLALLFGAFAFVMELEFRVMNNAIWSRELLPGTAHSFVFGGAVALFGLLASWLLEAYAGEEQ